MIIACYFKNGYFLFLRSTGKFVRIDMELMLRHSNFLKINVTFTDTLDENKNKMPVVFQDILNIESIEKLPDILNCPEDEVSGKYKIGFIYLSI